LTDKFPEKSWTKHGVNKLLKKLKDTCTVDRRPISSRPRSARTEENVKTVNNLVLIQEDKLQTHRTVREISRETGIHQSSVFRIICKDLRLKCFKRRRAQELTDANCAARMKRAKLLLQKFPQYAADFVFFTDKKVFLVTSPDSWQNKVSGRLRELLKKKLSVFFSAGTARSAIACRPPVKVCLCPATF